MKWLFYVIVFVYMFYRAVYGAKAVVERGLTVDAVSYGEEDFLKIGDHKSVSCKASNRNQKVEWVHPNGSAVKRNPSSRIFAQEHFVPSIRGRSPALVLTVTKAMVQDTGVYLCRSGDLTKNVSLCVIQPSEFVETPAEVTADIGRSITLSCQARGDPEPRLVWNRNGETITDDDESGKYKVMTKYNIEGFEGLLTITSLEPEDEGVYSCVSLQESVVVEDCSHTKLHNVTLNIRYAPTFESGNETTVYAKNNQQLDIVCSAQGYPAPTYRIFKELPDESLFEFDKAQIVVSAEDNQAALSVVANSVTFGQRFKCQAKNDLGISEQYITLQKVEKPRRIGEVKQADASVNTVELNVTWYDDITFPVTAFDVQYMVDPSVGKKMPKEAVWRRSPLTVVQFPKDSALEETGGVIITLPDLEAETSYWIRIRATNDAGDSPWSEPISGLTSEEDAVEVNEEENKQEESTDAPPEADAEPSTQESEGNNSTFYGIFFAGGIFVVSFVCMFIMRMVK